MLQNIKDLLTKPYPDKNKEEVENLLAELLRIGKTDDFLSERPGAGFNAQSRHIRTREIGKRLDQIGGLELMEYANRHVRRKIGKQLSSHLEYAWSGVGKWSA
jgi:hypothetical protein